ncbi:MAG: hypothetical protein ACI4R8_03800 [Candidatus Caccovivens sp.]
MEEEEIKRALLKRAVGYESDEIVEEYSTDENGNAVLVKRKITKKYNPPDINALKFLLEQEEFSDDEISKMTDAELLAEKRRLLQLLKEKENEDNENAGM